MNESDVIFLRENWRIVIGVRYFNVDEGLPGQDGHSVILGKDFNDVAGDGFPVQLFGDRQVAGGLLNFELIVVVTSDDRVGDLPIFAAI